MLKALIVTIFILLLLIVGMNIYLYLAVPDYSLFRIGKPLSTSQPSESPKLTAPRNPFDEAVFSYDVTQKQAIFGILGTNIQEQTMELRYIFPYELMGNIITVKVDCFLKDSWIIDVDMAGGDFKAKRRLASEPLYTRAKPNDTLQAICADEDCSLINKKCELLKPVN